ncbi:MULTISPECIES: hypothetical protein [unclassified Photobacterium]|nr:MULTISPECIES: hypothetical protein [unclassified Photobacterium]
MFITSVGEAILASGQDCMRFMTRPFLGERTKKARAGRLASCS